MGARRGGGVKEGTPSPKNSEKNWESFCYRFSPYPPVAYFIILEPFPLLFFHVEGLFGLAPHSRKFNIIITLNVCTIYIQYRSIKHDVIMKTSRL